MLHFVHFVALGAKVDYSWYGFINQNIAFLLIILLIDIFNTNSSSYLLFLKFNYLNISIFHSSCNSNGKDIKQ